MSMSASESAVVVVVVVCDLGIPLPLLVLVVLVVLVGIVVLWRKDEGCTVNANVWRRHCVDRRDINKIFVCRIMLQYYYVLID